MATITANPFLNAGPNTGALAGGGANAAQGFGAASASPAAGTSDTAQDASSLFMQLMAGMLDGSTTAEQLPSNVAAFLLTGDGAALELKGTDQDGEPEEQDVVLAELAALFPGLLPPRPGSNAGADPTALSTDLTDAASLDPSGRSTVAQAVAEATQAAVTKAIDEVADALAADPAHPDDATHAARPDTQPNSTSQAQSMLLAHKAAASAPQAASAEVRAPVGTPTWADEIGTHLTMMAANGRESASLRLSPEHLGPLEIRIAVQDGQASVTFGASNADTRSALEQSLPRLREMFASQGLVLADANVSRDAPRDSFRPAPSAQGSRGSSDAVIEADVKAITPTRVGLVDTYV